jgi:hypothetical protein
MANQGLHEFDTFTITAAIPADTGWRLRVHSVLGIGHLVRILILEEVQDPIPADLQIGIQGCQPVELQSMFSNVGIEHFILFPENFVQVLEFSFLYLQLN